MAPNARAECMYAINAFREYHGAGLVISSRAEDFRELYEKISSFRVYRSEDSHVKSVTSALLQFHAVGIAPLTSSQVEEYLSRHELKLTAIRPAIARDQALDKLSTTPLILTVMVKVFSDFPLDELLLLLDDNNDIRAKIYDRYIEQAFVHRQLDKAGYSTAQALRWLRFIAQQLTKRDETQLFIEEIQPDWLPFTRRFWTGAIASLLGIGLANRLLVVFFEGSSLTLSTSGFLIFSIVFGVGLGLFSVSGSIRPVDELALDISPRNIGRAFKENLVLIVLLGLISGFLVDRLGGGLPTVMYGAMIGVLIGLLGMQFGNGPTKLLKPLQSNSRYKINQGIHRSMQNTVIVGVFLATLFSILFCILFSMLGAGSASIPIGIALGLTLGTLTGMEFYGGMAVIRHYLLRFLLYLHHLLPLRLIPFLDAMRDRILLQRGGAHYRFIHRSFQEHVAALTDERIAELTAVQRVP